MRLTTVALAGMALYMAAGGSGLAQERAHVPLGLALDGLSPLLMQVYSDDMIRRAFQGVLKREPSNSELRRYRALVADYNWTERDIRRDLSERTDYQRYSTTRGMRPESIVRRAYQDILGRNPDAEGMRAYRSKIIDEGWTEQDVREALRQSPEYATGGGVQTTSADRIVRRAYQDILRREPDAAGLATYRRNIIERGWDEHDVREALRRSPEARQPQRMRVSDPEATEIVRRAYLSVLNREPDPSGLDLYRRHVLEQGWDENAVRDALRRSPEARQRPGVTRQSISDAEATEIVRRAYLSVLNREPDASGLQDYKAKVLHDRWTEQQVANALRNSDEYRAKHR